MIKKTKEGFYIIAEDSHIGKWVEENKRLDFDQNMTPEVLKYIKKDDFVFDIGANIGAYSHAFSNKVGKWGMVFCFEPSKEAFECLKLNLGGRAVVSNSALGSKIGTVNVIEENENKGMNFCQVVKNGSVEMTTLDYFMEFMNINKCDFIKIDVEGFELDVLNGAVETIKKFKPKMLIEINSHTLKRKGIDAHDIFNFLDKYNYTYRNIYPNQLMNDEQFDIICI